MRELSLFTGAGGGILGSKLLGWTTVGYVEWNKYCQQELRQRIIDQICDYAPIFGDITSFINGGYAQAYSGMVDIITAGFPCQPFSVAGQRAAERDTRNKWPHTRECIRTVRPKYALLENVPGLLSTGYYERICGDLVEIGYDCRWRILSAAELGAPHKRDRLWILAISKCGRRQEGFEQELRPERQMPKQSKPLNLRCALPNAYQLNDDNSGYGAGSVPLLKETSIRSVFSNSAGQGLEGEVSARRFREQNRLSPQCGWWATEPELGRTLNGLADGMDVA